MTTRGWKTLAIAFGLMSFGLLMLCGWLFVGKVELSLRAHFANEQTHIMWEQRNEALKSDNPHAVANCLGSVVSYYPSGSKQLTGSQLDKLVERHRADAAVAIICHLRELTAKDMGDDPEPWIREFSQHPL